jgi:hypothetical protein
MLALCASAAAQAQQHTVTLQTSQCFHDGAEIAAEVAGGSIVRWRLDAFTSLSHLTMDMRHRADGEVYLTTTQEYQDGTSMILTTHLSTSDLMPAGMVNMDYSDPVRRNVTTFNHFYAATQVALRNGQSEIRCRNGRAIQ